MKQMLSFIFVLPSFISAAFSAEMKVVGVDYSRARAAITVYSLENQAWDSEIFSPSEEFQSVSSPFLAIDRQGRSWMLWAGRAGEEPPRIYCSLREGARWSEPLPAGSEAGAWESTPVLTFDGAGRPWAAWAREIGGSTEIVCARWNGDGFSPETILSAPDDSPDGNPAIMVTKGGEALVIWEGWAQGNARLFWRACREGSWTAEEALFPRSGTDQTCPQAAFSPDGGPLVSFREGGRTMTLERSRDGDWRISGGTDLPAVALPSPLCDAWALVPGPDGSWQPFRPGSDAGGTILPRETGPAGTFATHYYIGYGDGITYGHTGGSDTSGWYGSLLGAMLESAQPGEDYYLYNQGYRYVQTGHLLNGGGQTGYPPAPGIDSVIDNHPLATKILIMGGTWDIKGGVPPSTTKFNLGEMIDRARAKGVEPVLGTIIPLLEGSSHFTASTQLSLDYITPLASEKSCVLADPFNEVMSYAGGDIDIISADLYGYPNYWDGVTPYWPAGDQKIADAWYAVLSSTPVPTPVPLSTPALPVLDSGDYNGDGTSDVAVFRPSGGQWVVRGFTRFYFGQSSDLPACGDYDGDGTTDAGIYRAGDGLWGIRDLTRIYFGGALDSPVPGDYNGDGQCEPGIFRGSNGLWAIRSLTRAYFGVSSDLPVPGYYSGVAAKQIAVFRSANGLWAVRNLTTLYLGSAGDRPVPADYNGDGNWNPAVFRAASGFWAISGVTRFYFGAAGDVPVAGEFLGGGTFGAGIFRGASGLWSLRDISRIYFGSADDIPVTGRARAPITR